MSSGERLSFKAILLGALTGIVLTFLWMMLAASLLWAFGFGTERRHEVQQTVFFQLSILAFGVAVDTAAGYAAARRGGHRELAHGAAAAVAMCVMLLPLAFIRIEGPPSPLWLSVMSYVLMLPSGMLGGWLASRSRHRTSVNAVVTA